MAKIKTSDITKCRKNVKSWITYIASRGMENNTTNLDNNLAAFLKYKTKHITTRQSSNCTLDQLTQRYENIWSYKKLL